MLVLLVTLLCSTICTNFIINETGQQSNQLQVLNNDISYVHKNNTPRDHVGLNSLVSFSGEGTQANPYQIKTISDLKLLRDNVTNYDKHFILVNDLTFTYHVYENITLGWKSIGNPSYGFNGTFDGNSKTIYNLVINQSGTDYIGLFAYVTEPIIGLSLENPAINGDDNVGGLVGENRGTIINSSVSGSVRGDGDVSRI